MTVLAAIYARISDDRDNKALGVQRQIKDCERLVASKGWTLAEVFTDNDISATSGKKRPAYERMLEGVRAGRITGLVVWDIDRLTRTPREIEDLLDLFDQHGVALASVGGEIDLGTPQGRLTARLKGAVAKHEVDQLKRRINRKMQERRDAGLSHGRVSYGWRREWLVDDQGRQTGSRDVLHPEQSAVIIEVAERLLAGESLRAIALSLDERGIPTYTRTGRWNPSSLRSMMMRPRNAGLLTYQYKIIGEGQWPAIFSVETYNRVVAHLSNPSRRTAPQSSKIKYLLSGIARCGKCGGPMRVIMPNDAGRNYPAYICQQAYCVRRRREPVEELVEKVIVGRLAMPDVVTSLAVDNGEDVQAAWSRAEELRARLDVAAEQFAEGLIDARQLSRITAKVRPELEAAESAAKAMSGAADLLDLAVPDIAEKWADVPLARKRAVIDRLISIEILPASKKGGRNTFLAEDIRITWK